MHGSARTSFLCSIIIGLVYFGIGIIFSALDTALPFGQFHIWRLAAWALSVALFVAQIVCEHFRFHNSPLLTAFHAATAAAIGAFGLAAAAAHRALYVGAICGGLIGCFAGASLGGRLGWIPKCAIRSAGIGASIGFAAAAAIATKTLQSPVGPLLSSLLIGIGGLLGI